MPSLYLLDKIRNSSNGRNDTELLLFIILSVEGRQWNEIHPEHLRIILLSLKNYKQGVILNNLLIEILQNIKLI